MKHHAVTCGTILVQRKKLLACHTTGTNRWDLPKGLAHAGEDHYDAAYRELKEETGIDLQAAHLPICDIGQFAYNSRKEIHLFAVNIDALALDVTKMRCTTFFTVKEIRYPEVDLFEFMDLDKFYDNTSDSMKNVIVLNMNIIHRFMRI